MLDGIRVAASELLSVPGSSETGSVSIVSSAIGERLAVTDYSGEMIDGIASLLNSMFAGVPQYDRNDRVEKIVQTSDAMISGAVSLAQQAQIERENLATVIDMTYPDQLGGLHPTDKIEAARITNVWDDISKMPELDKKQEEIARQEKIDLIKAGLEELYAGNDEFAIAA